MIKQKVFTKVMESEANYDVDIPESVTQKLMNMLQNKNDNTVNEFVQNASEEDSGQEKFKKKNCKKSSKYLLKKATDEPVNEGVFDSMYSLGEKKLQRQSKMNGNNGKKSEQVTLKDYENLKNYFEQFITRVVDKMETAANKKFKEISNRLAQIEQAIEGTHGNSRKLRKSRVSAYEEDQSEQRTKTDRKRRFRYIKTYEKLQYVDKILKGLITTKQVARNNRIKESEVQKWITNKDLMKENLIKKNKLPYFNGDVTHDDDYDQSG